LFLLNKKGVFLFAKHVFSTYAFPVLNFQLFGDQKRENGMNAGCIKRRLYLQIGVFFNAKIPSQLVLDLLIAIYCIGSV